MKTANRIAEKAFLELLNDVKPGKTEKELAARFDYLMALGGSDGVSFDTILLTGAHTSMPTVCRRIGRCKRATLCCLTLAPPTGATIRI